MNRYFKLMDDRRARDRWHLGAPLDEQGQELDPWQFDEGRSLELGCVPHFPLEVPGHPLDFCWAAFSILVVSERFVRLLERLHVHEVQAIPARVDAHPEPYFILNPLRVIRCIDDARCEEVRYFKPEDGQPEKVGQYRVVAGMRIDPTKVGDAHLFRPWGWTVALIVSEDLKQALEREGITGTRFLEV
ncbi:MAG TPA: DUF1629 domain-containing protein [Archangium sp.]|uniref:imm11 family protein n=1 Tax=Archangium sp. TaxID=1872627 RepID=UPI002E2F0460|nr:DUF1629 domain-containing protein [Archangium sp.]HEX5748053.1 DUF1629 domain-containing protein [Archangium sp.]